MTNFVIEISSSSNTSTIGFLVVSWRLIKILFNALPTSEPDSLVLETATAVSADNSSIWTPYWAAIEAASDVACAISSILTAAWLVI